jgi:adenosylcobinamide kinase/adenosylcobinamide-phosphate guanylyltransferase
MYYVKISNPMVRQAHHERAADNKQENNMKSILITGGARSGKSHYAQEMAAQSGKAVLFVATAQAGDEEMRRRIEIHRKSRPASWHTLEAPLKVGERITSEAGNTQLVLIDDITLLVNNAIGGLLSADGTDIDEGQAETATAGEINGLINCMKNVKADFVIVTNEVGLGLVPDNKLGRVYRDLLGKANQSLAKEVDEVIFMISGLPLKVKP